MFVEYVVMSPLLFLIVVIYVFFSVRQTRSLSKLLISFKKTAIGLNDFPYRYFCFYLYYIPSDFIWFNLFFFL